MKRKLTIKIEKLIKLKKWIEKLWEVPVNGELLKIYYSRENFNVYEVIWGTQIYWCERVVICEF